jgi:hypothetical protein
MGFVLCLLIGVVLLGSQWLLARHHDRETPRHRV